METNKTKRVVRVSIIVLIISFVGGFIIFNTKTILFGTTITITEPESGTSVTNQKIHIRGQVKNAKTINLSGRKTLTDPDGNFDEVFLLAAGYNAIYVYATDRFDRPTHKIVELFYKPRAENAQSVSMYYDQEN